MSENVERDYLDDDSEPTAYTRIADVEWRGMPYEFDMTRVYRHDSGELFYATDSGCSCPIPFERTITADLKPIVRMQDWYDHVAARIVHENPDEEYQYPEPTPTSAFDQIETARKAISEYLKASK